MSKVAALAASAVMAASALTGLTANAAQATPTPAIATHAHDTGRSQAADPSTPTHAQGGFEWDED